MEYESFSQMMVSLALVLPRIAAAFILLPHFSTDTIPPLVRNIFFVSLSLALVPLILEAPPPAELKGVALAPLVLKEAFIGIAIGYTFGIVFWALEGAGQIIDNKIGSTTAQLVDPITGHQTTLIGAYLGRLAAYVFAAFGGLHLFTDLLLSTFNVWPVLDPLPSLPAVGQMFFVQRFDDLMRLALLLAAPVLCVLSLLEFGLGFVNRYAPQLNVFSLSMAIKGWLAVFVLVLSVGSMGQFILEQIAGGRVFLEQIPIGR